MSQVEVKLGKPVRPGLEVKPCQLLTVKGAQRSVCSPANTKALTKLKAVTAPLGHENLVNEDDADASEDVGCPGCSIEEKFSIGCAHAPW